MKNKLILLLAVISLGFANSAYAIPQPEETIGPVTTKGVASKQWQPVRVIKLVRNADRAQNSAGIDSGDVVVYDTTAQSRDGVTVRTTTESGDAAIAGIAVTDIQTSDAAATSAQDDAGRRNWGFIVIHGPALADVDGTGGISAGDPFMTSADAGEVMVPVTGLASHFDNVQQFRRMGGFALEGGAGGTVRVFVQLE